MKFSQFHDSFAAQNNPWTAFFDKVRNLKHQYSEHSKAEHSMNGSFTN